MKRYVWAAFVVAAVLSGCAKEVLSEPETASVNPDEGILITFTAEKADCDAQTRTAVSPEDSKVVNWSEGDEISVFDAAGVNCRFTLKEGAGTPVAKFEGKVTKTAQSYTALYPYQAEAALEVDYYGTIHYHVFENVLIKTEQKAVEGSFDPEAAVMTARSEEGSNSLQFRNLMGFLKLIPKSDCSRITFTPTDMNETYGRNCEIVLEEDDDWNPRFGGGGCVESISISGDIKAGKAYYIAVESTFGAPHGFSLTFSSDEIDTFKRTSKALEIKRNTVVNLGEVEGVAESYLRFSADAEQSFSIAPMDPGKFEYSVGNGNWTALNLAAGSSGSETVKFGGDKGDLKLRGKSAEGTWCTTKNERGRIWFDYNSGTKVHCSGDIRTLVDWENYKTVDTGKAVFKMLFERCSQLVSAPELPATKLADNCYEGMFSYCSSLEKSPKLPATELSKECYKNMFYDCSSLYGLPELPAPAVLEGAYYGMFQMCRNIYGAPDLPAMQVASSGYEAMFTGCSSLTGMPQIAATSVGSSAMESMFSGCVNLNKITKLHLTVLAESCCKSMFYGCSSLTEAPELPDAAPARSCYGAMFQGCTALKVAPKIPSDQTAEWCYNNMFAGSGIEKAPDLPAKSVAERAYNSMFNGCQSLAAMPEIAATTVGQNGMSFMFANCGNLKTATDLKITDFTGTYNCAEMFADCKSLESAPALPATKTAGYCYSKMFWECTGLTSAPALPATELADHCYFCMFSGCTNLEKAPAELPATVLAGYCYEQMFRSCFELKTAPKLPAKTLATTCYNQMFYDCKKLTDAPDLPAEKMEESCYRAMFKGCSTLVSSPVLKVTEIAKECCYSMFEKCSALQNVTLDLNDFDNDGAFTDWLNGTAADGKLHIRAGLNETTKWCMKLPSGWSFVEDIID